MDSDRFDRVTKLFGTDFTRRSTLSVLSALAMGGLRVLHADAKGKGKGKGKKKKKTCKEGYKRCGIYCISSGLCCTDKDCPACEVCESDGTCQPDLVAPLCTDPCELPTCTASGWQCAPWYDSPDDPVLEQLVCCDCVVFDDWDDYPANANFCTMELMTLDECGEACDAILGDHSLSVAGIKEFDEQLGIPFCQANNWCGRKCPKP